MIVRLLETKEYEAEYLEVEAGVRYWDDANVNGIEDGERNIPCQTNDCWCPVIVLDTGLIENWTDGVEADIHYKICDAGVYRLLAQDGSVIIEKDGYVPSVLCPETNGYGDYIIMHVNKEGMIRGWKGDTSYFETDED